MQHSTIQSGVAPRLPPHSKKRLSRYGPLVLWAALIFVGSTSVLSASHASVLLGVFVWIFPQASEATLGTIHFLLRKGGHFTEYAILALLAARALRTSPRELVRTRRSRRALLLGARHGLGPGLR